MNIHDFSSTELGSVGTVTDHVRRKVSLLACDYALTTDDPADVASELLAALGLDAQPARPPACENCGGPIVSDRPNRRRFCGKVCAAEGMTRSRRDAAAARREARHAR